jgi:hypothetical protein
VAPFLIQDETPREERVPRETRHANGVTGIAALTVAVMDIDRVRAWHAAVLGAPGEEVRRDDVAGVGIRFTAGPHALEFVAPMTASSPLARWIGDRGSSPYAATLLASGGRRGRLDPARSQGARLSTV